MTLSPEQEAILFSNRPQKESTPETPKEKPQSEDPEIRMAEKNLRIAQINADLAKLAAPPSNVDYVKQMLDLQQKNFENVLSMQKNNNDLAIRLAKLEAGGDDGNAWIGDLLAYLPEIIKARENPAHNSPTIPPQSTILPEMNKDKGVNKVTLPTAQDLMSYKQKIKDGQITADQFYNDAIAAYPEYKLVPKETIIKEYEKIKAEK